MRCLQPVALAVTVLRVLLEPSQVDRVIEPALADALHEGGRGQEASWGTAAHLLWVGVVCVGTGHVDAMRQTRWWVGLVALAAAVIGGLGLQLAPGNAGLATKHLIFTLVGLVVALWVAVAPRRWVAGAGIACAMMAVAALAVVPILGIEVDGAQRWLKFGPLMIMVSTIALPAVAAAAAWTARLPSWASLLTGITAVILVAIQHDPASALVYTVVVLAAERRLRARLPLAALCLAVVAWAWMHREMTSPASHVEGAVGLLALRGSVWVVAGLGCIAVVAAYAAQSLWVSLRRQDCPLLSASSAGLLALLVVPRLAGDGGIPWLSFGGSSVVAGFVLMALMLRARRNLASQPTSG